MQQCNVPTTKRKHNTTTFVGMYLGIFFHICILEGQMCVLEFKVYDDVDSLSYSLTNLESGS